MLEMQLRSASLRPGRGPSEENSFVVGTALPRRGDCLPLGGRGSAGLGFLLRFVALCGTLVLSLHTVRHQFSRSPLAGFLSWPSGQGCADHHGEQQAGWGKESCKARDLYLWIGSSSFRWAVVSHPAGVIRPIVPLLYPRGRKSRYKLSRLRGSR